MDMDIGRQLTIFFEVAGKDDRIGKVHISIYLALLYCLNNQKQNQICTSRAKMMRLAKITGSPTYHKFIKEFIQYGYIIYKPSYHPVKQSTIEVLNLEIDLIREFYI